MNSEYNNSQIKKGLLDLFVLACLYNNKQYASEIILTLEQAGINLSEGTLYPLLNRLKNDQKIVYEWEESSTGPPRKYFYITQKGKDFLENGLLNFSNIAHSLKVLCKNSKIPYEFN